MSLGKSTLQTISVAVVDYIRVNHLRTFPCSQNPFRPSLHSKHKIYLIFSHTICYLKVATEHGFTGINIQNNKTEPIKQDNRLIQYNWQ